MTPYDEITADSVEEGDRIIVSDDPIEVNRKIDDGNSIMLKGYSHMTGDTVSYIMNPYDVVALWAY